MQRLTSEVKRRLWLGLNRSARQGERCRESHHDCADELQGEENRRCSKFVLRDLSCELFRHGIERWVLQNSRCAMTDGELLQELVRRSIGWARILDKLRKTHREMMGRSSEPNAWTAGDTLGTWSWFGYYWEQERFWFGYGWRRSLWQPVLSADVRSPHSQSWLHLRAQLPAVWKTEAGGDFAYLWSNLADDDLEEHAQWFHDRSRELHEYSLMQR